MPVPALVVLAVALAALENGVIDEKTTFNCPGGMSFYGHYHHCHNKKGHGTVNLHQALEQSCDVFFYNLGNKLGIDEIAKYAEMAGIGKKTAERIVVELKDKIGVAGALEAASGKHSLTADDQKLNDATLALMALGFKQPEAHDAVRATLVVLGPQAGVEQIVRACLKKG